MWNSNIINQKVLCSPVTNPVSRSLQNWNGLLNIMWAIAWTITEYRHWEIFIHVWEPVTSCSGPCSINHVHKGTLLWCEAHTFVPHLGISTHKESKQFTFATYISQTKKYSDVHFCTIKIQSTQIYTSYQIIRLLVSPQEPHIVHKQLQSTTYYSKHVYGLFTHTVEMKHWSSCQNVFISTALIWRIKVH